MSAANDTANDNRAAAKQLLRQFESEAVNRQRQDDDAPPGSMLGEWDAGDDTTPPPPRGWLLGNVFCRRFVSSLIADGGTGKTALRVAQIVSLATGRNLTGEHVFLRCRCLIICLEDDADELRRRILAARLHFGIDASELKGWLFLAAPGGAGGKLMISDASGRPVVSTLATSLERAIIQRRIDAVVIDPFVKSHSVEENGNSVIDDVMQILTDIAVKHDVAIDTPHHATKGTAEPGNANRGRGASSMKDAARLVYTLTAMSETEAAALNLTEPERKRLIRVDSAKVNIAPALATARWFKLVGVSLGNGTEMYPAGDEVQTVEPWAPPNTWSGLDSRVLNDILTEIDLGLPEGHRYSDAPRAADRAAWCVVTKHYPEMSEADARQIIKTWIKNSVLVRVEYDNRATRKPVIGLRVDNQKRPS